MLRRKSEPLRRVLGVLFKAHPWHGVPIGDNAPTLITSYIEIVPTDSIKYEVDKLTGHLKVDRPQKYSNFCPTPYGLVPQTYCAENVARLSQKRTGRSELVGDHDPLDICVLTEKPIPHGDILLQARPIGGLGMIDGDEVDDKIIAVLKDDAAYGSWQDISDCPSSMIDRIRHYFLTYKQGPNETDARCEIPYVYGQQEAHEVIRMSQKDYHLRFPELEEKLAEALRP